MFYNVENLFDTKNDPLKHEEEYLPFRGKFWNQRRLNAKINRISQVIIAVGGWEAPVLVGLCEIENHLVLNELLTRTPLEKFGYRFIHQESPDPRGIDVALLYRSPQFVPLKYETIPVFDPLDKKYKTRDILYVKGFCKVIPFICSSTIGHQNLVVWPIQSQIDSGQLRF